MLHVPKEQPLYVSPFSFHCFSSDYLSKALVSVPMQFSRTLGGCYDSDTKLSLVALPGFYDNSYSYPSLECEKFSECSWEVTAMLMLQEARPRSIPRREGM